VPTFVQRAGIAALTGPQDDVERMLDELRVRRDVTVAGLNALPGVSCRTPGGAFYAFPNVSAVGVDASTLAARLLEEAGVAVLAGTDFGAEGAGYLRVSYATDPELLEAAFDRMGALLGDLS
jgi:aspartate aminotransferase